MWNKSYESKNESNETQNDYIPCYTDNNNYTNHLDNDYFYDDEQNDYSYNYVKTENDEIQKETKIENKEKKKKKQIKIIQKPDVKDIECIWIYDRYYKEIDTIQESFNDKFPNLEFESYDINVFGYELLTTLNTSRRFKKNILILDGYEVSEKILNVIETNITYLNFLPEIIIYAKYIKENVESLNSYNLAFFNEKNIVNDFDSLSNIIFRQRYCPKKIPKFKFEYNEVCFEFEYINSENQLILPMLYNKIISSPSTEEIEDFNKFILDKYSDNKDIEYLINQTFSINTQLYLEIIIKYWLYIYTLGSNFYKDMNAYLTRKLGNDFDTYIKGLYNGLKLQSIHPFYEKPLFRGGIIFNDEIEMIKKGLQEEKNDNYPNLIGYSKAFFSTNIEKKVAFRLMTNKKCYLNDNKKLVLYEIKSSSKLDKNIITNADISEISFFKDEKEILFFPFSSFEIISIEEKSKNDINYYYIKLIYLGKYVQKFEKKNKIKIDNKDNKKILDKICDIPKSNFTINILQSNLFDKEEIKKEDDKKEKGKKMFNFNIETFIPKKNPNHIIAVYEVRNEDLFKNIKIINYNNVDNSCDLFFDDNKINFTEDYVFKKEGIYTFKFDFKENKIKSLKRLFSNCYNLISLDFSKFISDEVIDMSYMFYYCQLLESVNLTNFKTDKVTNFQFMFFECNSLELLDLSNLNFNNINDFSFMFNGCEKLKNLYLPSFIKEKNKKYDKMFDYCISLIMDEKMKEFAKL